MNRKCYIHVTQFLLATLMAVCLPMHGVAEPPSGEESGEDRALEIVRQASTYLTQTKQFRFTSDTEYLINPGSDQQIVFRASQDISVRRPNRVFGIVQRRYEQAEKDEKAESTRRIWYDGKTMAVLEEPDQIYSTLAVPKTIDATLDYLKDQDFDLLPLVNLLYSDLSFMETRPESWRYVGEDVVGEVRCHRLAFQGPESKGELWIEAGDKPFFRKAVVSYPQQDGQPQFTAQIDHWELGLELPDTHFVFAAPKGAKQMPIAALAPQRAGTQQAGQDAPANPDIDAQALEVLRQASTYLSHIQGFRVQAETSYEVVQESGQKLQFHNIRDFSIRRPDRAVAITQRDDQSTRRFWYDGKMVTILEQPDNVYGQIAVPDTIDATLDYLEQEIMTPIPLADLAYSDLSFLETRAASGVYVGKSLVRDVQCHHLAFRNEAVDWQLWIEEGQTPLFRKVVITYKHQDGQPQFIAWLHDWKLGGELSDSLFIFNPPEGAEQIQILAFDSPPWRKMEIAE